MNNSFLGVNVHFSSFLTTFCVLLISVLGDYNLTNIVTAEWITQCVFSFGTDAIIYNYLLDQYNDMLLLSEPHHDMSDVWLLGEPSQDSLDVVLEIPSTACTWSISQLSRNYIYNFKCCRGSWKRRALMRRVKSRWCAYARWLFSTHGYYAHRSPL